MSSFSSMEWFWTDNFGEWRQGLKHEKINPNSLTDILRGLQMKQWFKDVFKIAVGVFLGGSMLIIFYMIGMMSFMYIWDIVSQVWKDSYKPQGKLLNR